MRSRCKKQRTLATNASTPAITDRITSNPDFLLHRSPFLQVMSRHVIMPITQQQQINFKFTLPQHFLEDIQQAVEAAKQPSQDNTTNSAPFTRALHIRLFDLTASKHVEFKYSDDNCVLVKVNGKSVALTVHTAKKKKKQQTCFSYVQPLDVSNFAQEHMLFELTCKKNLFTGAAAIEIVNKLSVQHLASRVELRSELARVARGVIRTSQARKCSICLTTGDLSRCSRCKSAWYCSGAHQQQHWKTHTMGCMEHDRLLHLRLRNRNPQQGKNGEDAADDIVCSEIKVTVRDPLSLCRIRVPVRGVRCYHPQCVDLETYLMYCHNTKTWQCPICTETLLFDDLVVDASMHKIMNEIDDDIDLVRLNPEDYSYKVVTLEEQKRMDGCVSGKKRKREVVDTTTPKSKTKQQSHKKCKKVVDIIVLD